MGGEIADADANAEETGKKESQEGGREGWDTDENLATYGQVYKIRI